MPDELNPRQERFAQELTKDGSLKDAAIRAGYSPNGAKQQGHKLMKIPAVAARVAELAAYVEQQSLVDATWLREELVSLYERCMEKIPITNSEGEVIGHRYCSLPGAVRTLELIGKLSSVRAFAERVDETVRVEIIDLTGDDGAITTARALEGETG